MKYLVSLAILWTSSIVAQPTFMKVFRATGTIQADLNELSSGNLKVGLSRGRGTSLMDPGGNLIQSHVYEVDTFLAMASVRKYSDNEFFFVGGYYKDTCMSDQFGVITRIHPVVGKMDSLGNISAAHHYKLNAYSCASVAGELEVTSNKGVVAWGRDDQFFALATDSLGALIWAKHFDNHGGFSFIKELPGGDLLAGINMDTAGAVVARMNAGGNFLWCKSYFRPSGVVTDCVVQADDSFMLTGFTDSIAASGFLPWPSNYDPQLFAMKLNGEGEVQWCRGYKAEQNWFVPNEALLAKAYSDGYVLLANLGNATYNTWDRPLLAKINENGDTLWTRSPGSSAFAYETRNVLAYSDGGYIFNGRIWGDLPGGVTNFAYLYKTDSLGHLPCHEQWQPLYTSDLFPIDSSFTLSSVDGAEVRSAFITDSTFPLLTPSDACVVITGIIDPDESPRPHIRPNPNAGHFTVQFPDPLMAESYYSVYDTMGKLLYQRPLPQGKETEEVDLSRYGPGTYVLKFTEREGTCFERVVVE